MFDLGGAVQIPGGCYVMHSMYACYLSKIGSMLTSEAAGLGVLGGRL